MKKKRGMNMKNLLLKIVLISLLQTISHPSMVLLSQEIEDVDIKIEDVETNDAATLYNLGVRYFQGINVTKDQKEAVKYFQKAADQEHPGAQFALETVIYKVLVYYQ